MKVLYLPYIYLKAMKFEKIDNSGAETCRNSSLRLSLGSDLHMLLLMIIEAIFIPTHTEFYPALRFL